MPQSWKIAGSLKKTDVTRYKKLFHTGLCVKEGRKALNALSFFCCVLEGGPGAGFQGNLLCTDRFSPEGLLYPAAQRAAGYNALSYVFGVLDHGYTPCYSENI